MSIANTGDQASGQSLVDRIAAQFDITEEETTPEPVVAEEETTEAPEVTEPEEIEVEYEGSKYKVPKGLEKAILQEKDYTRKTQELAEQRRQLEQTESALRLAQIERDFISAVQTEHQQLAQIEGYLTNLANADYSQLTTDEKLDLLNNTKRAERQRETLLKSIESKRKEHEEKYESAKRDLKSKAKEALSKHIPSIDDALNSLKEYAKSQGYTENDFERISYDAKSVHLLWKAQRFDQLQAEKANAVKKVESPALKPGSSNPMPQHVKEKLALRKAQANAKTKGERDAIMQKRVELMFS